MIKRAFLIGLLALSLSGCVVQSLNPFYTDDLVVAMPAEMNGQWQMMKKDKGYFRADGSEVFSFSENSLEYKDATGTFHVSTVFFKIGDQLFVDLVLREAREDRTGLLLWNPHNLVRVVLKDGQVELWWPDYSRMQTLVEEQKVSISVNSEDSGRFFLIDNSEEIVRFLAAIKDTPDLYGGEYGEKWVLKRSAK